MKLSKSEKVYKTICYLFPILFAVVSIYPLLYVFFLSVCSETELLNRGGLLVFFPSDPTFAAYKRVLLSHFLFSGLTISILRTVLGTLLGIAITSSVGYAVSRPDLPGKQFILGLMLFAILFAGGMIPTYIAMTDLGLKNSFWVLVIPGCLNCWQALIFKQFFEGIPREIEEAAEVDGIGEFNLMVKIILPMSKPVFASIMLFMVVGKWNAWFDALIYIDTDYSKLWPLQMWVQASFNNLNNMDPSDQMDTMVLSTTVQMALTIITMLPILIIYPFFQKYFTKGVYMGAVKG